MLDAGRCPDSENPMQVHKGTPRAELICYTLFFALTIRVRSLDEKSACFAFAAHFEWGRTRPA